MRTEVESVRSAEPASSQGSCRATAFSTLLEALRVAVPFSSGSKLGISASHPAGSSRLCIASISAARSGLSFAYPASPCCQSARTSAPADPGGEALVAPSGDGELGVLGPAVGALGLPRLLLAERGAVDLGCVVLVRRAPADVAVDDDDGWPSLLRLELLEGARDQLGVVGAPDPGHVPAVALEAGGNVVFVGELGFAVDRDLVVVVDPAEVVELEVAGDRGSFTRDALHQTAVAADRVNVEVEEGGAVAGPLPLRGNRHPDRGRDSLAERSGGRLDPGGPAVLGVTRSARAELTEALYVPQRDRALADHLVIGIDRLHLGEEE